MSEAERKDQMRKIRDEVWNLTASPLYRYRKKNNYYPVLGEGSHTARVCFIGEAPGKNEAEQGRPFCGAAGRILDELLASIHLDRGDVYITNILKDRPPENRDPAPAEIELYTPFLERQINVIKPRIIATLGRFAKEYVMKFAKIPEQDGPISKIHGKKFEAELQYGKIYVIPLYHPAVAVYNAESKETLKEDFKIIARTLKEL